MPDPSDLSTNPMDADIPGPTHTMRESDQTAPAPTPHTLLNSVPWTFWLWVAIIVLAYLVPRLGPKPTGAEVAKEAGLSQHSFERYTQAEIRTHLLFSSFGATASLKQSAKEEDLVSTYRSLAQDTKSPNMARRALIVASEEKKPFDKKTLDQLQANLRTAGSKPAEITDEVVLWQALYGGAGPIRGPAEVNHRVEQIRSFHIGFLEDKALQDLYSRAGDKKQAGAAERRLSDAAQRQIFRLLGGVAVMGLAGLVGFVFLILFITAWSKGDWSLVGRIGTRQQRLTWGDLLDSFAFYLACARGIGLAVGMTAALETFSPLAVIATLYVVTGGGAAVYLGWRARQRGASLADLGLRSPGGLFADIGYGILGYCTALPLVFALGQLSRLIFRDQLGATNTPNPILPLMAGERDPGARLVIYLLVAVAAPVLEELFFRGALFTALRTRYPWAISALFSGALFAMMHPIQDWPQILGLGFALAAMREMRQSLVPGMVAHCLQNSMSFIFMSLLFSH